MTHAFLEVRVDDRPQLVQLDAIQEIVAMCDAQRVDTEDPVCAVLDLRGRIVPLLDLSRRTRALTPDRFILVCSGDAGGDFGLIVDDVQDLRTVADDQVELAPGRPAFARIGRALHPVTAPLQVWREREQRGPGRVEPVDDPAVTRLLRARADRCAEHDARVLSDVHEHAVFVRHGRRYAVDLRSLREIRALDDLCIVPGAPAHVPGIVHSRGRLLSVHDLGAYLDAVAVRSEREWLVIVEDGDRQLGLVADAIEGITPFAPSEARPTPVAMGPRATCFTGVVAGDVLLLDPAGLFDTPTFFLADA
jgi:purine-binding chemotaxis protein CheW